MARPPSLLLAIFAGFAAASACYAERQPPPTFRYTCDSDSDCNDDEACLEGLCQVPCSQQTFEQACTSDNHLACFNGVCSTGCDPDDDDACPPSQECIDLGLSVPGGSFIGGGTQTMIGICGSMCSESSCPAGEVCIAGACAAICTVTEDCPNELECFMGFCAPPGFGTGDGGASADASDASDESTGAIEEAGTSAADATTTLTTSGASDDEGAATTGGAS